MSRRFVAALMIVGLVIVALVVYESTMRPESGGPSVFSALTPGPLPGANQEADYAAAQATLAAGQGEIAELSHQATVASLSRNQAADAAAQATLDIYQRELMELSIRSTEISQNMAQAAATQQFLNEQTQLARNATAAVQSQAATATYSAYIIDLTQTAQAAQANATLTAFWLTATPWAALQVDIARIQKEAERRAWWDRLVVSPLILFLLFVVALLLIAGGAMVYLRRMPVLKFRPRSVSRVSHSPLLPVTGRAVERDPLYRQSAPGQTGRAYLPPLPGGESAQVEIVDASASSIVNWIAEAEQALRAGGWT